MVCMKKIRNVPDAVDVGVLLPRCLAASAKHGRAAISGGVNPRAVAAVAAALGPRATRVADTMEPSAMT